MTIDEIIKIIQKTENAQILLTKEIEGNKSLKKYHQVISVETELSLNHGLRIIQLYVAFKEPMSVYLPKIFIDERCYDDIKFIPHVNDDFSICIVDESENYSFRINDLPTITLDLISKAKSILRDKDDTVYCQEEFKREFSAYWNINYDEKNVLQDIGLCLIDFINFDNIKAVKFLNNFGQFQYLVYNLEDLFEQLEKYLKIRNIKFKKIEVFISEYENVNPPFKINYNESINYIRNQDDFKRKVNKLSQSDFIVIFKTKYNELYGWLYPLLDKSVKGCRGLKNWQYLQSSISRKENVKKISFANISPKRLDVRTSGIEIDRDLSVAIVGLGSVGSNLLHFLTKYPISEYYLIDPDILKVENVFRNNFGFNFISRFKTKISEQYILILKNPFTEVQTSEKDVCEILKNNNLSLEKYDVRFIILGVTRIEKLFTYKNLISIDSDRPIIIMWVEPYLASGQLIYIRPNNLRKLWS
ncbi:E2/UBC family protein [Flavobacterium sp. ACAM 123]|uniref:E2/UBC family protein n=1 Tax=Flavobacterium sp. ACAM 123 TaxID=1189620 RepID=UPI0002ECB6DF|nr:E2/UBC family protein [Flavobacterium sp. ACAM 123]